MERDAVAECSDEIDPKVKAALSVAVGLLEDAEDLEPPDDMCHRQSDLSESAVVRPLIIGQWMELTGLLRGAGVGMPVLNPLIPSVGEEFCVRMWDGPVLWTKLIRVPFQGECTAVVAAFVTV